MEYTTTPVMLYGFSLLVEDDAFQAFDSGFESRQSGALSLHPAHSSLFRESRVFLRDTYSLSL